MPVRSSAMRSAVQTGLNHAAISIAAFAAIAGVAIGLVYILGDENASTPVARVGLFSDKPGASPILKARLDETLVSQASVKKIDDTHATASGDHEPSLPVDLPDHATSDYASNTADHNAAPAHDEYDANTVSEDASEVKVTRISVEDGKAASKHTVSLPRAPLLGFYERGPVGKLPKVNENGQTPAQAYARPHAATDKPKVALVVGGLGLKYSLTTQAIRELPPEVTLSFVPYSKNLNSYIKQARDAGHEVLLELPMEPYDYPNVDTGPETLMTSLTPEENERRLKILLGQTTGYFGVTNYQGAKLATDSRALAPIMETLRKRGLAFFYDGGAPRSVFPSVAEDLHMDFAEADRIVDTRPTADSIDRNLLHLEALALQNGQALGVGFAYPVTVDQFKSWTDTLEYKGYELVPASMLAGVDAITPLGDKNGDEQH